MHSDKHRVKYVDPVKNPNLWLELTILKMIEDRDPANESALRHALHAIIHWIEPGLIDQLFGDWIQQYLDAHSALESNQNNFDPPCSLEAGQE
jgi:hypothetical protein